MRELSVPLGALRRTGELALAVLGALPDMSVLVFDAQQRYVLAGGTALEQHGLDAQNLIGRHFGELVSQDVVELWGPAYTAALRGERTRFDYRSLDGTYYYDVEVGPIESDGDVVGGLVITRDVTARRKAHTDLAASEREYRSLADRAADVVTRTDTEAQYRYVSPSCAVVYGRRPEEMVGRSVYDYLHPDDHDAQRRMRAALADGADEQLAERRMSRAGGGWVWVESRLQAIRDPDGRLTGVQTSSRDISDRKAAEEARAVSDEQFRTAFDDAPIGMALVSVDGAWLRSNSAMADIVGYTQEELQTRTFQDITHPDDVEADLALVREVLAGDRRGYQMEKRYIRKDGSPVWVSLSVSLVRDTDGAPLHLISHVEDISGRKRLEAELTRMANHDDLTGLHNRRHFERELTRELKLIERHGGDAAVLLIDLDGFKAVNDTHGHAGGDELLRHVASTLRGRVRETDLVARYGGDEFSILLRQTSAEAAERLAATLTEELASRAATIDGTPITAHASIGAAPLRAGADALRLADQAMYERKRAR